MVRVDRSLASSFRSHLSTSLLKAAERLMVFLHRDAGAKVDPAYEYFMDCDLWEEVNAD